MTDFTNELRKDHEYMEKFMIENHGVPRQPYSLQAANHIDALREALEGWMLDHGDRCRICMERSQSALKGLTKPKTFRCDICRTTHYI